MSSPSTGSRLPTLPRAVPRAAAVTALTVAVAAALAVYGNRHQYFDLKIYVSAMRWWAQGRPLYDYAQADPVQGDLYFTYPPFAALLLWPFGQLPLDVTIAVFTWGTAAALAVTTYWLVAPVADRRGLPRWYAAGLAVPLAFLIEPSRETITFGQLNLLLVVLVLADLLFAIPRGWRLAGAGIGLATAIKLVPGIFIVYLLVTRRWRAALVACAAAVVATLFAAAVAPRESWQFWTESLHSTTRVGRTDYTGNQSLLGLLGRLVAPAEADRLVWLVLVGAVAVLGLWGAAGAAAAGDEVAGLALAGLVGSLVSPITWPHHIYWFIPAFVVLADAALPPPGVALRDPPGVAPGLTARAAAPGRLQRGALLVLLVAGYAVCAYGVVSFVIWDVRPVPTDSVDEFLMRNALVLLSLVLVVAVPIRRAAAGAAGYRTVTATVADASPKSGVRSVILIDHTPAAGRVTSPKA
ncbi:MAG TPA: glycosyltransferase family 87 protein [Micromonosporaceae bacterium]|nr:glycosyltransferase family 87 protein [Micromonosporaceae bacterium]